MYYCISLHGHSWWGKGWEVVDKWCQMWQCILKKFHHHSGIVHRKRVLLSNGTFSKTDSFYVDTLSFA